MIDIEKLLNPDPIVFYTDEYVKGKLYRVIMSSTSKLRLAKAFRLKPTSIDDEANNLPKCIMSIVIKNPERRLAMLLDENGSPTSVYSYPVSSGVLSEINFQ